MSPRLAVPAALALLAAAAVASSALFTVHQTKQAIVLQFGALKREVRDPGLHVKLPFIQNVRYLEARVLNLDPPVQTVVLSDQRRVRVDVFVRYRITNPSQFVRVAVSESNLRSTLGAIVNEQVRAVLGAVTLGDLLSQERPALMADVRARVNRVTTQEDSNFGIDVLDVRIGRADLSEEVSQAVYARMRAERERDAAEFRAEGQEEYQTITADADRQATVILAEAQREAQETRGRGDAERTRVLAESHGRDPEFFAFWRSLEAYRSALADEEGGRTQYVLPPEGDFFRFFEVVPEGLDDPRAPLGAPGARRPVQTLMAALGLAVALEGAALLLLGRAYPEAMRRLAAMPPPALRAIGLALVLSGLLWTRLAVG